MSDINLNEFSTIQLKNWLSVLCLPTAGTKAELVSRLSAFPVELRGEPPELGVQEEHIADQPGPSQNVLAQQPFEASADEHQLVRNKERGELQKLRREIEASKKVLQQLQQEIASTAQRRENNNSEADDNGEFVNDEARDSNGDSGRRSGDSNGTGDNDGDGDDGVSVGSGSDSGHINVNRDATAVNDGGINVNNSSFDRRVIANIDTIGDSSGAFGNTSRNGVTQHQSRNVNKLCGSTTAALALAKEVAQEYNGESCARSWAKQIKNIARIYELDATYCHLLILAKLKGKAQQWLHGNDERILVSTDQLLEQLILTFGGNTSKAENRNMFQKRLWKFGESFVSYYEEKIMLAGKVNIDKEELLENIIDGIPSPSLRNQARIQCFNEPAQILKAFAGIHLSNKVSHNQPNSEGNKEVRCLNCNSKGHMIKECRKPKREPGSCYACGAFGHFVGQCPERKSNISNNYNAS